MSDYTQQFIDLVKMEYDAFHNNRNGIYKDLNLFYVLEFTFIIDNNMVRCLWHKDWDHIHIHWNFHAQDYLNKKTVVWSMPRDVPLIDMAEQFNGLSETLFKNTALYKVCVSTDNEL